MKKKNETKKDSKIKTLYHSFKDAWSVPYKRAGIKLLGYLIFFIIFFLIAGIVNRTSKINYTNEETVKETTEVTKEDNYNDKQNKLINNKHSINYIINKNAIEYIINGDFNNNIVNGYLETNDTIKKILIEDDKLYELKNNEKIDIDIDIDINLLDVKYIFNLLKGSKTIIERKDNDTNYFYTINIDEKEVNIKIYTDEDCISKIELFSDNDKYILNFDK